MTDKTYTVTLYLNPDDHREPLQVSAKSPNNAAWIVWGSEVDSLDGHACALVVDPEGVETRVSIEPTHVAARITRIGPVVVSPLSAKDARVVPGFDYKCYRRQYVWPTAALYVEGVEVSRQVGSEKFGAQHYTTCHALEVQDRVRDFTTEDPSQWGAGASTYRSVRVREAETGLTGWIDADGLLPV